MIYGKCWNRKKKTSHDEDKNPGLDKKAIDNNIKEAFIQAVKDILDRSDGPYVQGYLKGAEAMRKYITDYCEDDFEDLEEDEDDDDE